MGIFKKISKGLFGGKKKQTEQKAKEEVTGTTSQAPWAPAIPGLTNYLTKLPEFYANTPMFSPTELEGVDMLREAISGNDAILNPAIGSLNDTLSGKYLDASSNPYLQDIATRMGGEAMAGANASFGGRGRGASGLNQYYVGKGVSDAVGDVFGGAYESERGRMLQAAGMMPQFAASKLLGPSAMIDVGQNFSARPFDLNAQMGGIMAQIANLGGTSNFNTSGTTVQKDYKQSPGLFGKIANKLGDSIVKLF